MKHEEIGFDHIMFLELQERYFPNDEASYMASISRLKNYTTFESYDLYMLIYEELDVANLGWYE